MRAKGRGGERDTLYERGCGGFRSRTPLCLLPSSRPSPAPDPPLRCGQHLHLRVGVLFQVLVGYVELQRRPQSEDCCHVQSRPVQFFHRLRGPPALAWDPEFRLIAPVGNHRHHGTAHGGPSQALPPLDRLLCPSPRQPEACTLTGREAVSVSLQFYRIPASHYRFGSCWRLSCLTI